jgi:1,4-dihydroxy-6-naphthoate synthase
MNPLSIGYSPCPNDTFIFYALVHDRIDTNDLLYKETLEDVETLNRMAFMAELDITKVSIHAFAHLMDNYCLLHSGAAIGKGCGPLVVAGKACSVQEIGRASCRERV